MTQLISPEPAATTRQKMVPDQAINVRQILSIIRGRDCHAGEAMYKITEITDESFTCEVVRAGLPVLLFLWSPQCSLSKAVGPTVVRLAAKKRRSFNLVMANIEDVPHAAAELSVEGTPTLLVFESGEELSRRTGAMLELQISRWIQTTLNNN